MNRLERKVGSILIITFELYLIICGITGEFAFLQTFLDMPRGGIPRWTLWAYINFLFLVPSLKNLFPNYTKNTRKFNVLLVLLAGAIFIITSVRILFGHYN